MRLESLRSSVVTPVTSKGELVGGAAIEKFARDGDASRYIHHLTVPMLRQKNCDFSYAGALSPSPSPSLSHSIS